MIVSHREQIIKETGNLDIAKVMASRESREIKQEPLLEQDGVY